MSISGLRDAAQRRFAMAARIVPARVAAAFAIALVVANAGAQTPYELPANTTEADLQQVVVPLSDAVKRKITEALSRDNPQNDEAGSTGDPILDDVLNVIRRQGSVLDGSSLDPQTVRPAMDSDENPLGPNSQQKTPPPLPSAVLPLDSLPSDGQRSVFDMDAEGPDARFHVAESLLRAARMLAALPNRDAQRNRVIAAMREQATMLMIDEFSQQPTGSQ